MKFLLSKSFKKIQAFLLVTAMVIGSFSSAIAVKADTSGWVPGGNGSYRNNNAGETDAGGIKLTKRIIEFDKSTGEYTVDLRVDGYSETSTSMTAEPVNIVLVIDKSGSMGNYDRMTNAKKSAKAFLDEVDKVNRKALENMPTGSSAPVRVGIVSYADNASTDIGLTDDINALKAKIDSLKANGATFTQGGLVAANGMLRNSSAKKVIILISDGEPTYAYRNKEKELNENSPASSNEVKLGFEIWYKRWTPRTAYRVGYNPKRKNYYMPIAYRTNQKAGTGSECTEEIKYNTIYEALTIQKNIDNLYSIGIGVNRTGRDILQKVANSGYYETDNAASDLGKKLNEILKDATITTYAIEDGKIADALSEHVVPVSSSATIKQLFANNAVIKPGADTKKIAKSTNELELKFDNGKLTLTGRGDKKLVLAKSDFVIVQYKVKLKDMWKDGEWHKEGAEGAVFYPNKADNKKIDFANPEVKQLTTKDLAITKVWKDDEGYKNERPSAINFQLNNAGDTLYKVKAALNGDSKVTDINGDAVDNIKVIVTNNGSNPNQWDIKVEKLPVYSNGLEIDYKLSEEKVTGYSANVSNNSFTITNTLDKTDVTVTKIWEDNSNKETKRPSEITFTLNGNDGKEYKVTASTDPVTNNNKITLNEQLVAGAGVTTSKDNDNQWTIKIEGLKKHNKDGNEITYTVTKEDSIESYVTGKIVNNQITNKLDYSTITQDIFVKKVWNYGDYSYTEPDKVTVNLVRESKPNVVIKKLDLTKQSGYSGKFEGVAVYEKTAAGVKKITDYTVKEVQDYQGHEKFTAKTEGSIENGFVVTNTINDSVVNTATQDISVKKVWNYGDYSYTEPDKVTVNLVRKSNPNVVIKKLDLSKQSGYSGKFEGVAVYEKTAAGVKKITDYTVKEVQDYQGHEKFTAKTEGSIENGFVVTNTINDSVVNTATQDISVKKVWNYGDYSYTEPDKVTVNLVRKSNPNVVIKKLDLSKQSGYSGKFEGVAVYEKTAAGEVKKITDYTVREVQDYQGHEKFTAKTEGSIENGFVVTNTINDSVVNTATQDISVKKVWNYGDYSYTEPDKVTVNLVRKSNPNVVIKKLDLSKQSGYSGKFEGVAVYEKTAAGEVKKITDYTVREVQDYQGHEKFTAKTEGSIENGFVVTNTINDSVVNTATQDISVKKVWNYGDYSYTEPDKVTVNLVRKSNPNVVIKKLDLSKQSGYSGKFEGVAVYEKTAAGEVKKITDYTVREVQDYQGHEKFTAKTEGSIENGFVVTNTINDSVVNTATQDISVKKVWNYGDYSYTEPDKVTVNLVRKSNPNVVIKKLDLTKQSGYSGKFEGVAVYEKTAAGVKKITDYTVKEVQDYQGHEKFTAKTEGSIENGFVVTNTINDSVVNTATQDISVKKVWNYGDYSYTEPDKVTVNLVRKSNPNVVIKKLDLSKQSGYSGKFEGVAVYEKTAAGVKKITDYTVKEVQDYQGHEKFTAKTEGSIENGFVVTNTINDSVVNTATQDISVKKVWNYGDYSYTEPDKVTVNLVRKSNPNVVIKKLDLSKQSGYSGKFEGVAVYEKTAAGEVKKITDYTVREVQDYQGHEKFTAKTEGSIENGFVVTNTINDSVVNTATQDISVKKVWNYGDYSYTEPDKVTVNLVRKSNPNVVIKKLDLSKQSGYSGKFEGVAVYEKTAAGVKKITDYTVKEVQDYQGHEKFTAKTEGSIENGFVVTNTINDSVVNTATQDISVKKVWNYGDYSYTEPDKVTVNLVRKSNPNVVIKKLDLSKQSGYSGKFEGVAVYEKTAAGVKKITDYTVKEVQDYQGHEKFTAKTEGSIENGFVVTNTINDSVVNTATQDISVKKVWNYGDYSYTEPDKVTVNLVRKSNPNVVIKKLDLSKQSGYSGKFEGVAVYEKTAAGEVKKITDYTVREVQDYQGHEKFTAKTEGSIENGFVVTNTINDSVVNTATQDISVKKVWNYGDYSYTEPDKVTVNLVRKSNPNVVIKKLDLSKQSGYSGKFEGVAVYEKTAAGEVKKITDYTVREVQDYQGHEKFTAKTEGSIENGFVVTNTINDSVVNTATQDISVKKVWNYGDYSYTEPDKVTVNLVRKSNPNVVIKKLDLSKQSGYSGKFEGVAVYEKTAAGEVKKITDYTVREVQDYQGHEKFTAKTEGSIENGFVVTNTINDSVVNTATQDISVKKVWNYGDYSYTEPDKVTVNLVRKSNPNVVIKKLDLTKQSGYSGKFEGVAVYEKTAAGEVKKITDYTVKEVQDYQGHEKFTAKTEGSIENGFVVTNTINDSVVNTATQDISVKKVWNYGDYSYTEPDKVTVNLVRKSNPNVVIKKLDLTKQSGYIGKFEGVAVYEKTAAGEVKKITDYTVKEVQDYQGHEKFTAKTEGSIENGFVVTNTINDSVVNTATQDISVKKVWNYGDYSYTEPDKVTVNLVRKSNPNVVIKKLDLSKQSGYSGKFEGVAVYEKTAAGEVKKITDYTVREVQDYQGHEKFTAKTEGSIENGFVVTNTINDSVVNTATQDISVKKVWNYGDYSYTEPDKVTVNLVRKSNPNVVIKKLDLSKQSGYSGKFEGVAVYEKTAAGEVKKITDYTVREVQDYQGHEKFTAKTEGSIENGFVVTNTINDSVVNTATQDISVKKVWNYGDYSYTEPDKVTVNLVRKSNPNVVIKKLDLTKQSGYSGKFEGVAVYEKTAAGEVKKITDYTVKEVQDYQGHEKFTAKTEGSIDKGFVVTNTIKGNDLNKTDNLTITVVKEWDNNISGLNIPNELKVTISNSVNGDKTYLTLNPDNKWTATTDKLNKYEDNGNFITYTVTEDEVKGFKLQDGIDTTVKGTASVVGKTEEAKLKLINVAENGENDGKIKINIKKVDSADETKGLGGAVFKIVSLGDDMQPNGLFAKTVTSQANGEIAKLKLPVEGIYKIEETKAPQGYIKGQDVIIRVKEDDQGTGSLLFQVYTYKDEQGNPLQQPEWKDVLLTGEFEIPTFTIKNTKIKNDDIFKIDEGGTPLSGARFDLYKKVTTVDGYSISAEVDNSSIPQENIDVTAQLYRKHGEGEADPVGESVKLTTSELNKELVNNLIPNAGDKYYATFSFSTRFTAESIVFDATRNTFVLKLVLNTAIAQPSQPDPDNTESNGAGKAETAQPAPSENNEIDNSENNNNETNNSGTNNSETTTVKSLPAFTAMPTETDTNTNTEESGSAAPTEDTAEAAPQDTKNDEAVTEEANKDVAENVNEAEKAEGQDAANNPEKDKVGNESDAQKYDSEQKRDETNKGQDLTPLGYAIITETSEMVELSGDYAKYQTTEIVSDDEGRITLPNLPDGSYYLLETAAPVGNGGHYDKEDRKIRFDIGSGNIEIPGGEAGEGSMWLTRKVTQAADGSEVSTYQIVNTWVPDPSGNDPYIPPLDDPSNQPPVTIDDSNTPLTNPDNTSDTTEQNSQTDDDEDVILDDDLEDDEVPLANAKKDDDDEDVDIDSDKVPLTGIPKTADKARHIGFYIASCAAGILLLLSSRFRKKED